jgi:type VI secretion system protein VasD
MVFAAAVAGCAKAPPPPTPGPSLTITAAPEAERKASMTLSASADTNPDGSGRPSPIVVRVYQLKTDAAFAGSEFFALFDDEQKVLGAELITRDEFMLSPSELRTIDVALSGETRYVGVLAAFRDFRNSQWLLLQTDSRRCLPFSIIARPSDV